MTTPPPDHITRPDFGISVRGYDRTQVDAYFGRVVEWLADAENRATATERARESLARELTTLRATVTMLEERAGMPAPQSMSMFSERMSQVMESALQAAQELRAEAEQEARERRESAADEVDRLVASARDEAAQIVDEARRARQETEESIEALRAAREEAVGTLLDLQQRIAAVVGEPCTMSGLARLEVDRAGHLDDGDDVTTVVPVVTAGAPDDEGDSDNGDDVAVEGEEQDDVEPTTRNGVLVTAAPTTVQPAVERRASAGRRRTA